MKRKKQSEYKLTNAQLLLGIHLEELHIRFRREEKFCDRQWRLDLFLPEWRIGVECSGGNFSGGHRRFKAQEDEYDKLNVATMAGIRILQFTNAQVLDGRAKQFIAEQLGI